AALPGGDPLQAALAAGELPSPEMVVNAGVEGTLAPAAAAALAGATLAGIFLTLFLNDQMTVFRRAGLPLPRDALVADAQRHLRQVGHTDPPWDWAASFDMEADYMTYVRNHDRTRSRWDGLATDRPGGVIFWYTQTPSLLAPLQLSYPDP